MTTLEEKRLEFYEKFVLPPEEEEDLTNMLINDEEGIWSFIESYVKELEGEREKEFNKGYLFALKTFRKHVERKQMDYGLRQSLLAYIEQLIKLERRGGDE